MHRYRLLSIKCNMCDWRWEITPEEKNENLCCKHCGSKDLFLEENMLHFLKNNGKIISDIGYSSKDDCFRETIVEDLNKNFDEPLLVLKQNNIKFSSEMNDEERMIILGKINSLRSQIIDELKESNETCFQRLK